MYYYYKLLQLEKMELKSDSYVSATDDSCKDFQVLDELILNPSLLCTIIYIIYFMNKTLLQQLAVDFWYVREEKYVFSSVCDINKNYILAEPETIHTIFIEHVVLL